MVKLFPARWVRDKADFYELMSLFIRFIRITDGMGYKVDSRQTVMDLEG